MIKNCPKTLLVALALKLFGNLKNSLYLGRTNSCLVVFYDNANRVK